MKGFVICLVLILLSVSVSNTQKTVRPLNPENKIFIITLDGFRWEEVFRGADSGLLHDPSLNSDTTLSHALYWDASAEIRRRKLMPFFWSMINRQGELFGNRDYNNKVNISNPYALSYPGYSELLTGEVDYTIYNNDKRRNGNRNILQILNNSESYRGKVAAFTSWDMFSYILNKKEKNSYVLNSGLQSVEGKDLSSAQMLLNAVQGEMKEHETPTRYDELTFIACKEYILKQKPSVVFLSFSGTDNAAHDKQYDQYLQQANNADHMISELWRLLQEMPEYAGKTTFLITTDHGRGNKNGNWSDHGVLVPGSTQTWYALLGNTVVPHGEMKSESQIYTKQLNSLVMELLTRK